MESVFVSLGSNLGKRFCNIHRALEELLSNPSITFHNSSPFYFTEPVDIKEQAWFINVILKIGTKLEPLALLALLKNIERNTGRTDTYVKGPRIIDLDILFYHNETISNEQLTLPHPEVHKRNFILKGMLQMGENIYHPLLKKSIEQIYRELKSEQLVVRIPQWFVAKLLCHSRDCTVCDLIFDSANK